MNPIEEKFKTAFTRLMQSEYIVQHTKPQYKIIGKTVVQPIEESSCECEQFIIINYETFLRSEKQKDGSIYLYFSEQTKVNGYSLDFFLMSDVPDISMGIEIDGHDWHERTKEQASTDKKRERRLLALGIPCIRFTGSDVFTNAEGCAKEAIDIFFDYYFQVLFATPESFEYYLKA